MKTLLDEVLDSSFHFQPHPYGANYELYEFGESVLQEEFNPNDTSTYQALTNEILRLANQEKARWQSGGIKETSASIYPTLMDYWTTGVGTAQSYAATLIKNRTPWSAAFISWVLKNAGAGNFFKYSSGHYVYIAQAKKGRMNSDYNMVYWLYRLSEHKPRVGDLICNSRNNSGLNYDNAHDGRQRSAHCDIVIQVLPDRIIAVGGNKSDSVAQTTLWLRPDGYLDAGRNSTSLFGIMSMW